MWPEFPAPSLENAESIGDWLCLSWSCLGPDKRVTDGLLEVGMYQVIQRVWTTSKSDFMERILKHNMPIRGTHVHGHIGESAPINL